MKTVSLPYLYRKTVKGRKYLYFRQGKALVRLPDNPDSPEFSAAYWACRTGKKKAIGKHTWNDLIISYYRSPAFRSKKAGTQANYRRHCEAIREKNGKKDMRDFRRKDALAVQAALGDHWSKANERLAVLSILCKHAVDLEWIERNPVVDIDKLTGGEYEAWPDAKLLAFERAAGPGTVARTAYELAIGTGQRIGDCCSMRWDDFDGEFMGVVQEKTGTKIRVYCPLRLRKYLSSLPVAGRYIMARNLTQPLGKRAVQKAVEDVREKIGALGGSARLVPHGWRYTAAKQLAEAGCSDAEIQAVTGHKTLAMVQKYRAQANQSRTSKAAQDRRERTNNE